MFSAGETLLYEPASSPVALLNIDQAQLHISRFYNHISRFYINPGKLLELLEQANIFLKASKLFENLKKTEFDNFEIFEDIKLI